MATVSMSTTAATTCIFRKGFVTGAPITRGSVSFATKNGKFTIRNSGELSSEVATTEVDDPEASAIEAPAEPPSLISALNVEKALRGIAITDADHYGRLGIQRGCPYDQVTVAYKNKVEEVMNQGLELEELNQKLDLLKESHAILSTVEERRLYDWSLSRSDRPERYVWPFEADITQIPTQIPPPGEPEDVGPTRLVGYFILAWILLSFALSIALNR